MSNEKTEEATPKRREKEREKGNISKSQDLSSVSVLISGFALLYVFGNSIVSHLKDSLYYTFTNLNPNTIEYRDILSILYPHAIFLSKCVVPFLGFLMIIVLFLVRAQVGTLFAVQKIKPSMQNLTGSAIMNKLKKMFNPFSPKNLFELAKSFLKMIIVGSVGYNVILSRKDDLMGLVGQSVPTALVVLGDVLFNMLLNMCVVMLFIAFIDKKYQDYEYNKSIKMSKQDIKDEFKNAEGDPKIKAKVKAQQMAIMNQKMMAAVPKADVIVTNPTHFAVALKYDKINYPAPVVVAKGVDFMAFKIREIAQNNNVPIVENKPLARSLYKLVDVNKMIPPELYTAVAEVLAYIYNKNKK
mgnify:FL=1